MTLCVDDWMTTEVATMMEEVTLGAVLIAWVAVVVYVKHDAIAAAVKKMKEMGDRIGRLIDGDD